MSFHGIRCVHRMRSSSPRRLWPASEILRLSLSSLSTATSPPPPAPKASSSSPDCGFPLRYTLFTRSPAMFDKFREECGVFGVLNHRDAANIVYLGLYALQHRGQESAGIASVSLNPVHSDANIGESIGSSG